jgi:hypothetical protein
MRSLIVSSIATLAILMFSPNAIAQATQDAQDDKAKWIKLAEGAALARATAEEVSLSFMSNFEIDATKVGNVSERLRIKYKELRRGDAIPAGNARLAKEVRDQIDTLIKALDQLYESQMTVDGFAEVMRQRRELKDIEIANSLATERGKAYVKMLAEATELERLVAKVCDKAGFWKFHIEMKVILHDWKGSDLQRGMLVTLRCQSILVGGPERQGDILVYSVKRDEWDKAAFWHDRIVKAWVEMDSAFRSRSGVKVVDYETGEVLRDSRE